MKLGVWYRAWNDQAISGRIVFILKAIDIEDERFQSYEVIIHDTPGTFTFHADYYWNIEELTKLEQELL